MKDDKGERTLHTLPSINIILASIRVKNQSECSRNDWLIIRPRKELFTSYRKLGWIDYEYEVLDENHPPIEPLSDAEIK